MYRYEISGSYFEYNDGFVNAEHKHFDFEIEASDSVTAMQIALGKIMLNTINTKNAIKLDDTFIHECL